jgi:dCMP deaminase
MNTKWHYRYLDLCKLVSTWSKDPSTQCGAVIVDQKNRIVSTGFNGFPIGVHDDSRLHNREIKHNMILHAEENAILFANKNLAGCTIYSWPLPPCSRCAAMIIQSGLAHVVTTNRKHARMQASLDLAVDMFKETKITLFKEENNELIRIN